jgi:ElaB/YqjD/DUF883 family membrane-anchored ribosome-binding protein
MLALRHRTHTDALSSLPACGHEKRNPPPTSKGNSMNTIGTTPGGMPQAQQGQDMGDDAANAAQGAIRSTQRAADQAFNRLSEKVDQVRDKAAPVLNKVSSQAEAAARRGMEAVRDTSQQLRERAAQAQDMTVAYVKDEPIKAMLIAAATGAILMGLITMLGRSRD